MAKTTTLYYCAIGATLGWVSTASSQAVLGMFNIGTMAGAAIPVAFWIAYAIVRPAKQ